MVSFAVIGRRHSRREPPEHPEPCFTLCLLVKGGPVSRGNCQETEGPVRYTILEISKY